MKVKVSLKSSDIEKAKAGLRKLDDIIVKEYAKEWNRIKAGDSNGQQKKPRCNNEGYADPTAYEALQPIIEADTALENKVNFLIKVLKFISSEAGFDILNRIELQDKHSGRVFK